MYSWNTNVYEMNDKLIYFTIKIYNYDSKEL